MMCSKLRCQKFFKLKLFSYKLMRGKSRSAGTTGGARISGGKGVDDHDGLRAPLVAGTLRGVISKVNSNHVCQPLTTISHKMASRTRQSDAVITPRRAFCGLHSVIFMREFLTPNTAIVHPHRGCSLLESSKRSHARPFEPYPKDVLGAVRTFLEPFRGRLSPKVIKILKMTFD